MGLFKKKKPETQESNPSTPDRQAQRDQLFERMKAGDPEAMSEIWDLFFDLDEVCMVARGSMPSPTPFIANVEGRGMLAVFTSVERAVEFSAKQGTTFEGTEAHATLSNPMIPFIDYASRLSLNGVDCIIVDEGVGGGYYAPISNLIGMYERAKGDIPLVVAPAGQGEFDHRTHEFRSASDEQEKLKAAQRLWSRYFLIPYWYVLTDEQSGDVLIAQSEDGRGQVLLCSDQWSCEGTIGGLEPKVGRKLGYRRVETKLLVETLESYSDQDLKVLINLSGVQNQSEVSTIREIWDEMTSIRSVHGLP